MTNDRQFAECAPAPLNDPGEAAAVWRQEKLRQYLATAASLGFGKDPEFQHLLSTIRKKTNQLEALWQQQQACKEQVPWWADGEYSIEDADSANDCGTQFYKAEKYSKAFDSYTEAIRLCPNKAVYHANRAAAALRLRQPSIALIDARNAMERDKRNVKAYLRAGMAQLQLKQPTEAVQTYRALLGIDEACKPAQAGLERALLQAAQEEEAAAAEVTAAQQGSRTALSRGAISEADAAQLLLTADEMLEANPRLVAAKCARVEALIYCRRYEDALLLSSSLPEGPDSQCLQAEARWRCGDLVGALEGLSPTLLSTPPQKVSELRQFVSTLKRLMDLAEAAHDDGIPTNTIEACSEVLSLVDNAACSGLSAKVLHLRASSYMDRRLFDLALADLQAALALEHEAPDCLLLRSLVYQQLGRYEEGFLDLQRLRSCVPGMPGLFERLQEAASLCLAADSEPQKGCKVGALYTALGVTHSSSAQEIRTAYRQLAARWHPDKWLSANKEAQDSAAATFQHVQQAYDVLGDELKRRRYDCDLVS